MMQFISSNFIVIVVALFVLFALAEMLIPMNKLRTGLGFRWFTNLMLTIVTMLLYKLLGPAFAVLSAWVVERLEMGLFNQVEVSLPLLILSGILLMDFKQYWFHRLMHYFDVLWLVHRVHHSDVEIDLTTGFRFHPLEAILSAMFDLIVITVFGIAAEALLLRYLLIYLVNFFNHGNIHIPARADRILKWILVTPSMHHLHHAMDKRAANSNFGVMFSFWDRLFGTYMSKHPQTEVGEGESAIVYGLREYREPGRLNLWRLVVMPFVPGSADSEDNWPPGNGKREN